MREVVLAARPIGWPKDSDFRIREVELPQVAQGEILVRVDWLSVDPYMRGRMNDQKSYVPPFALDSPLAGGAVGTVVETTVESLPVGAVVTGTFKWREFDVVSANAVMRIEDDSTPPEYYLGVLGMPGMTAYYGLLNVGNVKEGDVVYVSAAAGAVGSIVGQIARIKGCRTIGSAGGPDKVRRLAELGFDVGVDYRSGDLREILAAAAPAGINVYFDNVGGDHLEAALWNMADFGRIVMCGAISLYNSSQPEPGPKNLFLAVQRRLRLQGFIVSDHFSEMGQCVSDIKSWVKAGKISLDQTVVDGLESAPTALVGLMKGQNLGKMLVKVS